MLINIHTHHTTDNKYEILNSEQLMSSNYFSFGLLPTVQNDLTKLHDVESIITHKNCIAIGEIGIDKTYSTTLDKQIELFIKQVFISENLQLPILLHCVKSWNEISEIRTKLKPKQPWIFHGFRKTTLLESVLKSGTHISIGTAVIWDKKLQDCVKNIPIERLFLETDNDLNYTIMDVYAKICSLKNISLQTLEEQLYKNTKNTFTKWEIG